MSDLVGLLLGAGHGQRYDPQGYNNKLLAVLPDGRPIALAAAQAMRGVLLTVLALLPDDDLASTRFLATILSDAGCTIVSAMDAGLGMGHTLAAGVAASSQAAGWLVQPADMPWLQSASCAAVVSALREGARIAAPVFRGQRGHPVGFASSCRAELLALRGDQGAREVLQHGRVHEIMVNDAGVIRDVDVPGDMQLGRHADFNPAQLNPMNKGERE